ncbi:hypothetical protein CLAIMM_14091 [Cladophialophora immunda]|nr:hypothetical protein CLAIMM_14091 [Cladophialophora immunda]
MSDCFSKEAQWRNTVFVQESETSFLPEYLRKEHNQPKPITKRPDPSVWASLARLAYRLGFRSDEILRGATCNSDEQLAERILLTARPPPIYSYDKSQFEISKMRIIETFQTARQLKKPFTKPSLLVQYGGEELIRRSGRPFENAYEHDRLYAFLPVFWSDQEETGEGISSVFVRIAVLKAFLGDLILPGTATSVPELSNNPLDENGPPVPRGVQAHYSDGGGVAGRLEFEMEKLKIECSQLRTAVQQEIHAKENAEHKLKIETEKSQTLEGRLSQIDAELAQTKQLRQMLETEKEDLNLRLLNLEKNSDNSYQRDMIDSLQQKLSNEIETKNKLNKEFENSQSRVTALEMELSELRNNTLQQVQADFDIAQEENRKLNAVLHENSSNLRRVESERTSLRERLTETTAELTQTLEQKQRAEQIDQSKREQMQETLDKIHSCQAELQSLGQDMESMKSGRLQLLQGIHLANTRSDIFDKILKDQSTIKQDLAAEVTQRVNFSKQILSLESEATCLRRNIESTEGRYEELTEKEISALSRELAFTKSLLQDTRKENNDLRSQLVNAENRATQEQICLRTNEEPTPQQQERSHTEAGPYKYNPLQNDEVKPIHFYLEGLDNFHRVVAMTQRTLESTLNSCKKNGLVPYHEKKAMLPHEAWDVLLTSNSFTIHLELLDSLEVDESVFRERKRKRHNRALAILHNILDRAPIERHDVMSLG